MDSNIDYIGKSISELQANINIAKKFTFMVEDLQNKVIIIFMIWEFEFTDVDICSLKW